LTALKNRRISRPKSKVMPPGCKGSKTYFLPMIAVRDDKKYSRGKTESYHQAKGKTLENGVY
jgi:hypothetical protein